jgi:hypothetical protein
MLGGVVGGAIGDREEAGDGGDVDDGSAAGLEHFGSNCLGQQERRDQIHVEDTAQIAEGGVFGGRDEADACVVDEHVDAAVSIEGPRDEVFDDGGVGEVARVTAGFVAGVCDGLHGFYRIVKVDDDDAVASAGEEFGRATADAAGSSGDDGDALARAHFCWSPVTG